MVFCVEKKYSDHSTRSIFVVKSSKRYRIFRFWGGNEKQSSLLLVTYS